MKTLTISPRFFAIEKKNYTDWKFEYKNDETMPATQPTLSISPLSEKLFHGDCLDENGKVIISISHYRSKNNICGVLLTSEKSYGRENNKLLYKCVPDDEHLPCFLIPYEEKNIGFSKTKTRHIRCNRISPTTPSPPVVRSSASPPGQKSPLPSPPMRRSMIFSCSASAPN